MAYTSNNRVTTTTRDFLMPKVVDTVLNSNVFAKRMLSKAEKWSGTQMKHPVKVSTNGTGSSFSGYDTFSTNSSDTRVNMAFDPKFYKITVSLPLDELSVNATEDGVLDLAKLELQSTAQDMADAIGTIFYSDGTGNGSKDFLGLGAIVDDGNTVSTIGGLSRSTYSTLASTVTASGGALTIAKMATLYNAVSSGSVKPTVALTTEVVHALYEGLLQPQERIMKADNGRKGLSAGTGSLELFYKGLPVIADEKCTSGVLFFLNEDFLHWYALPLKETEPIKFKSTDIEGNDYSDVMGLGFSWSGWIKPLNQAAIVSHIYLGGNLTTDNPKRHGKLTGITTA